MPYTTQVASFPSSVVTDANSGIATNVVTTTLTVGCDNVTTSLTVASAVGIEAGMDLALRSGNGFELVTVTAVAGSVLTVTRSVDGTTAVAHAIGTRVKAVLSARYHNRLREELQAVQTYLLPGGAGLNAADNETISGNWTFNGTVALSAFTQGSIVFSGASGVLTQNNTNLFWDNSNNRLGVGLNTFPNGSRIYTSTTTGAYANATTVIPGFYQTATTIAVDTMGAGTKTLYAGRFDAPTLTHASSTTIATAATLAIEGAPVAGSGVTITNTYSLYVFGGVSRFGGVIQNDVTTGTAPFTVASTTVVTNLNADLLDGFDSAVAATGNTIAARDANGDLTVRRLSVDIATGTAPFIINSTTVVPNLNADLLDGFDETAFGRLSQARTWIAQQNYSAAIVLANNIQISGQNNASTPFNLARVTSGNKFEYGEAGLSAEYKADSHNFAASGAPSNGERIRIIPTTTTVTGTYIPALFIGAGTSIDITTVTPTTVATMYLTPQTLTASSPQSVTNYATLYINAAGAVSGSASITNNYALWVDGGSCRFDGDGVQVFELPADATGNASGAVGRVPIRVGGTVKYLRYFND